MQGKLVGLYLCNFGVLPAHQGRGLGLDLLEAAALCAVENKSHNDRGEIQLIGTARASNAFIVTYYKRLGSQVVQTGFGTSSSSWRSASKVFVSGAAAAITACVCFVGLMYAVLQGC